MKKSISYISKVFLAAAVLTAGTGTFSSCSDYLDVEVGEQKTAKEFYNNAYEMDEALNGVYSGMMSIPMYQWYLSEVHSDNIWSGAASEGKANAYGAIHQFASTLSENSTLDNAWVAYYTVIARANSFISRVQDVVYEADSLKMQQIAEARFLRALAYFDLVRFWGRVPATTESVTVDMALTLGQSEPVEIYDNIIVPDLKFAIENLNETPLTYNGAYATDNGKVLNASNTNYSTGKPTPSAAKAVLGRVYITEAGFPLYREELKEPAKELLLDVINYSNSHGNRWWASTADEWRKMWMHDNDNKYFLFEIQYVCEEDMGNPVTYNSIPNFTGYNNYWSYGKGNGYGIYASEEAWNIWSDDEDSEGNIIYDARQDFTIDPTLHSEKKVLVINKWLESDIKRAEVELAPYSFNAVIEKTMWPQNYPIIRLEDVMLMYAELAGNTDATAKELVNRIRTRTGRPALTEWQTADSERFLEAVKDERRREFMGEGIRWHDLVRWDNDLEPIRKMFYNYGKNNPDVLPACISAMGRIQDYSYLYPIPYNQMKINDGLYQQNPGY